VGYWKDCDHTLGPSPLPVIHRTVAVIWYLFRYSLQFNCICLPVLSYFAVYWKIGYKIYYLLHAIQTFYWSKWQHSKLPGFALQFIPSAAWVSSSSLRWSIIYGMRRVSNVQPGQVIDGSRIQNQLIAFPSRPNIKNYRPRNLTQTSLINIVTGQNRRYFAMHSYYSPFDLCCARSSTFSLHLSNSEAYSP